MGTYRLYCLNDKREVVAAHWIDAASDEEAVNVAKTRHPDATCEVWRGTMLVATVRN